MVSKKRPKVIVFPMDLLSGKNLRLYKGNSKIEKYNLYEEIKTLDDIKLMNFHDAREYILKLKEVYGSGRLKDMWSLSTYELYAKVFKKYNIPTRNYKEKIMDMNDFNFKVYIPKSHGRCGEDEVLLGKNYMIIGEDFIVGNDDNNTVGLMYDRDNKVICISFNGVGNGLKGNGLKIKDGRVNIGGFKKFFRLEDVLGRYKGEYLEDDKGKRYLIVKL